VVRRFFLVKARKLTNFSKGLKQNLNIEKLKKIKDAKIFSVFKKKETVSTKALVDVTEHANVIIFSLAELIKFLRSCLILNLQYNPIYFNEILILLIFIIHCIHIQSKYL